MRFKIGDTAFRAWAGQTQVWATCPECLGSGRLTVILGDGQRVGIDCECCRVGFGSYAGRVSEYQFKASVETIRIDGFEVSESETRWKFNWSNCGGNLVNDADVFETHEGAMRHAECLVAAHEKERELAMFKKDKPDKSWAWNASYHRRELKCAQEQVKYHASKLEIAKTK